MEMKQIKDVFFAGVTMNVVLLYLVVLILNNCIKYVQVIENS